MVTAPLFVGLLIDLFSPYLPESRGYSMIWPITAVMVGVSMLVFRTVEAPGTPAQEVSWAGDPPRDSPTEGV